MDQPTDSQAIARREGTSDAIIRTPQDYAGRLQRWHHERYHVLSPLANFTALPDGFGLVPTLVQLDDRPEGGNGDVYQDGVFTRGTDVAIAKIGLTKIAQAAGMSITTVRTDDRRIQNLWEVQATAKWIGIDGTPQLVTATEELDLRDGSSRTRGYKEKQLEQARSKGLRNCEARAINAAIRLFGIKQKYSREELKKPFVIVRVVYTPDMSDPETRRAVTERRLAGTSALYGQTALPAPAPTHEVLDTIGAVDAKPAGPGQQKAHEPTARGVVNVAHEMEAGVYDVTFEGGEVLSTRNREIAEAAVSAKRAGQKVRVQTDEEGMLARVDVVEAGPAAKAASSQTAPSEPVTLPEGAVLLDRIDQKSGKTPGRDGKPDRAWTLYTLVAKTGEKWTTFDTGLVTDAEEAIAKGWPVRITDQINQKYPDQRDVVRLQLIDPRQGSLLVGEDRY